MKAAITCQHVLDEIGDRLDKCEQALSVLISDESARHEAKRHIDVIAAFPINLRNAIQTFKPDGFSVEDIGEIITDKQRQAAETISSYMSNAGMDHADVVKSDLAKIEQVVDLYKNGRIDGTKAIQLLGNHMNHMETSLNRDRLPTIKKTDFNEVGKFMNACHDIDVFLQDLQTLINVLDKGQHRNL